MPAQLSDPEWTVWEGVLAQKPPGQIAKEQTWSPQYVSLLLGQLRDKGCIQRVGTLPSYGRYREQYPWTAREDDPPVYKPALPPVAKLRQEYIPTSQRDRTVRPIRIVEWLCVVVQGVPIARSDGKGPKEALTDRCVVVIDNVEVGTTWKYPEMLFRASLRERWRESQTAALWPVGVTLGECRAMTLVIACAIGVEALLDLTTTREDTSK